MSLNLFLKWRILFYHDRQIRFYLYTVEIPNLRREIIKQYEVLKGRDYVNRRVN